MVCGRTLGLGPAILNKEYTGRANNEGLLVQQVPAIYGSGIQKERKRFSRKPGHFSGESLLFNRLNRTRLRTAVAGLSCLSHQSPSVYKVYQTILRREELRWSCTAPKEPLVLS